LFCCEFSTTNARELAGEFLNLMPMGSFINNNAAQAPLTPDSKSGCLEESRKPSAVNVLVLTSIGYPAWAFCFIIKDPTG
jgi:hypothetical protein